MRGDDQLLTLLIAAFVVAALAYYLLSVRPDSEPAAPVIEPWTTRLADWFGGLFDVDPADKLTGGTTPKEEVDPGDPDK